jgi:D-alanine-D-alanine ligase
MRIGVLLGGLSSQRDLSLRSGEAVHAALVARGHDAVKIFVDGDLDVALRAERIDVAFVALHGRFGEDGCVQGLCELRNIPYTGSSVLGSALSMDKLKAKELFRLHNLPTPSYYLHRRSQGSARDQHGAFGFPVVCKPRGEGASLGVRRADDLDELEAALEEALRFDEHVLVERCIEGREVHVALLGGHVLGAVELVTGHATYEYGALSGAAPVSLFLPPRLSAERLRGVAALAERAAQALSASGLVEVDLLVGERDNESILEIDTEPLLLPQSPVVRIAHAAGLDFGALVEAVLARAQLHARRRQAPSERFADGEAIDGEQPPGPH